MASRREPAAEGAKGAKDTEEIPSLEVEIADVAARLEGLAASRAGGLDVALKMCARRLHVALLLRNRLDQRSAGSRA